MLWTCSVCVCVCDELTTWTHPLTVFVTVQSCVLCPTQASVSTTSCMTSSPCVTPTRTWTSTSTASSAVWFGSKPCSVSQRLDHKLQAQNTPKTLRQAHKSLLLCVSTTKFIFQFFCFFLIQWVLQPYSQKMLFYWQNWMWYVQIFILF